MERQDELRRMVSRGNQDARLPIREVRRPVQPGEIRREGMGPPGQKRRDEIHRHHLEAPRWLRHVSLGHDRLVHQIHSVSARSAPRVARSLPARRLKLCFYHSIMDWHHPDWGTRRPWNDKASGTPDMDRYTAYMKGQLKELLTGYGPIGILWFDGEWEKPWTHERGVDLY